MNRESAKQINRALRHIAKEDPRLSINEFRVIVALERAIARLERHQELAEHLVFKGGLVLFKIFDSERFTRDADALAVAIDKARLEKLARQALESDLDDGLWFGDIHVDELDEQGQYGSYRFDCAFQIGEPDMNKLHKLSRIHVDVGFSDKIPVTPPSEIMPSILGHENPVSWKVYSSEYIFAEKLETMYDRGSVNSRAKDIYDLAYLIQLCPDKGKLIDAIRKTFMNRNTPLPASFVSKAEKFEKAILKAAWPGIRVLGHKAEFEETWAKLMEFLGEIDTLITNEPNS